MSDLKIYLGHQCDLYSIVRWFLPYETFEWEMPYLDYNLCDLVINIKINLNHCDLYFMVQWLCLVTGRLFDGEISYLEL